MIKRTTQVPNAILDTHLKNLKPSQLLILLVIVRQTLGWIDSDGKRKKRDWISQKQFIKKTGLSARTISRCIDILIEKKIIMATDFSYTALNASVKRKGKTRIYYEYIFGSTNAKKDTINAQNLPTTKLIYTKDNQGITRLSDWERFQQIKSRDEYD